MAFTKTFRINFPKEMQARFKCYWHVMHPVTFDPAKIYRAGWDDATWDAWHLIKKTREEVLMSGHMWYYKWNWKGRTDVPAGVPQKGSLSWECEDSYPSISVKEKELPSEAWQDEMREWVYGAHRYRVLGYLLSRQIKFLLKVHAEYAHVGFSRRIISETSICNTPAQLLAIWPELITFLPPDDRDEMRGRRMRFSPPRDWTPMEQCSFHGESGMDEVTHALQTMALIPDEKDKNYPGLSE